MSTNQETIRKKETEITRLEHILALLSWDQETGMPGNALQERSEQMAWIQQQISDRILDPRWEEELAALGSQASGSEERSWHRALVRRHRQYSCLPPTFMAELVKVTSLARDAWASARRENDFSLFQPHLEQVVDLAVQRAGLLGFKAEPYDALLDLYEPGMTAAELEKVFNPLETELKPLIGLAEEKQNGAAPYDRRYPIAGQEALSKRVLRDMGFDFASGRMDFSVHPFTTTLGSRDIRVTTRLDEPDLFGGLYSTVHEGGHGLYEQNLPASWAGTLAGEAASMGFHESQSRMWENIIGRSLSFWEYLYPLMTGIFPEEMKDQTPRSLFRAANRVERSLIRVDADEVTYNMHIILRFRLERQIINGTARVSDLPELWRAESENLLGVRPEKDADGVLQDIHWSLGDWGYFPTYTLGNLYSAQIWESLREDLPDPEGDIRKGDFSSIQDWLSRNVHSRGALLTPDELIRDISGEPLSSRFFLDYLKNRIRDLYAE